MIKLTIFFPISHDITSLLCILAELGYLLNDILKRKENVVKGLLHVTNINFLGLLAVKYTFVSISRSKLVFNDSSNLNFLFVMKNEENILR